MNYREKDKNYKENSGKMLKLNKWLKNCLCWKREHWTKGLTFQLKTFSFLTAPYTFSGKSVLPFGAWWWNWPVQVIKQSAATEINATGIWLTEQPQHYIMCLILLSALRETCQQQEGSPLNVGGTSHFTFPSKYWHCHTSHGWHMSWDLISPLIPKLWQNVILFEKGFFPDWITEAAPHDLILF